MLQGHSVVTSSGYIRYCRLIVPRPRSLQPEAEDPVGAGTTRPQVIIHLVTVLRHVVRLLVVLGGELARTKVLVALGST